MCWGVLQVWDANVRIGPLVFKRAFLKLAAAAWFAPAAAAAHGTSPHLASGAGPRISGGFLAVSAADAAALGAWWREMLGFEVLLQASLPEHGVEALLLTRGASLVEIMQRREAEPAQTDAHGAREAWRRHGYFKAGFFVDDLDALEADLRARGGAFEHGVVRPQGNPLRTFAVRDPEGNLVQFFGH